MNAYQKALEKVKREQEKYKNQLCCTSQIGIIGPTGPTGAQGEATTIMGSFNTLEELVEAYPNGNLNGAYIVGDYLYNWSSKDNKWVNVGLIRGPQGEQGPEGIPGPEGPAGIQGKMGPTGPAGPVGATGPEGKVGPTGAKGTDGTSVTILGYYDTYQELVTAHPEGEIGNSYLVEGNLYVWSQETKSWVNVGQIRGPEGEQGPEGKQGPVGPAGPRGAQGAKGDTGAQGPRGEIGPEGPRGEPGPQGIQGPVGPQGPQGLPGLTSLSTSYFFTSSEDYPDGEVIKPNYNVPIENVVLDMDGNFYFNRTNDTITFLKTGTYLIVFTILAKLKNEPVIPGSNIISFGFRINSTPSVIYAGCSVIGNTSTYTELIGMGTINIVDAEMAEIINTSKNEVIVGGPDAEYLGIESSFASPIVNILAIKLK